LRSASSRFRPATQNLELAVCAPNLGSRGACIAIRLDVMNSVAAMEVFQARIHDAVAMKVKLTPFDRGDEPIVAVDKERGDLRLERRRVRFDLTCLLALVVL